MDTKNTPASIQDLTIAYIGGGSRGWAWAFMSDLALDASIGGTIRLYDTDLEAAKQNQIIGNNLQNHPKTVSKWHYQTTASLQEALTGADFIVISILPGTFDEMESDVHTPEQYGIYQSVGDSVGPGGTIRALRTIPQFVSIAQAIQTFAPKAWVMNYTNPMSLCVKTLYKTFPQIKAFGCCHEVFGTQKILRDICSLALETGETIDRPDIKVNVLGLNHFTWFDFASYKNYDLFPIYQAYIQKHLSEGYNEADKHWANSHFDCAHLVKFDLFQKYGWIAAAGDRHLAEFLPGDIYLKDPAQIKDWKYSLTTVEWRKKDLQNRLARGLKLRNQEEQFPLDPSGEEGIQIIKALCGLAPLVSNVNIPNTHGQIENIPVNTVVETNALFERDTIRPIFAGEIKSDILSLMMPHIQNQESIFQAAIQCDFNLVLESFMRDPLLHNRLEPNQIKNLALQMIQNTQKYLPAKWKQAF